MVDFPLQYENQVYVCECVHPRARIPYELRSSSPSDREQNFSQAWAF